MHAVVVCDAREQVWLETPSNPATKITDIQAVAQMAHAHGYLVVRCAHSSYT